MLKLAVALTLLSLIIAPVGCAGEDPTCAPPTRAYRFCSDDQVWECPEGTPDQLAKKKEQEDRCKQAADPVKCAFDIDFEMIPAVMEADCASADQRCDEDHQTTPSWASCKPR